MNKRRFNIWLTDKLIEEVKTASEGVGISSSAYMRVAILEKLKMEKVDGNDRIERRKSDSNK